MATTTYLSVEGEIVGEDRAGSKRDYVPDPLGSVRALLDNSQSQTDTYTYWPFGETQSSSGSGATPMRFVGSLGGRQDHANRSYFRSRTFEKRLTMWTSKDPLWPREPAYRYCASNPTTYTDPLGLALAPPYAQTKLNRATSISAGRKPCCPKPPAPEVNQPKDCVKRTLYDITFGKTGDFLDNCGDCCIAHFPYPSFWGGTRVDCFKKCQTFYYDDLAKGGLADWDELLEAWQGIAECIRGLWPGHAEPIRYPTWPEDRPDRPYRPPIGGRRGGIFKGGHVPRWWHVPRVIGLQSPGFGRGGRK